MAGPVVPKFGSWDAENIGYTVFFEKVRENKTTAAPAPAAAAPPVHKGYDDYEFDPYEHYENLSRNVPSRPASSHGHGHRHGHGHGHAAPAPHRPQQQHGGNGYHRRSGSNGSTAASEASSRGSKFSPPRPYQPRYSSNGYSSSSSSYQQAQQGGGHGYDAGAYAAAPGPRHHQHAAARVAASPPRHAPPPARTTKASAVPRFGVWDEQNSVAAAQGFTVQFDKVKRHREVAKAAPAPDVPPRFSPEKVAPAWRPRRKAKKSFLSKVYRCLFPVVRQ